MRVRVRVRTGADNSLLRVNMYILTVTRLCVCAFLPCLVI